MNKCIFLGRISKDIEVTFAAGSGTAIAKFSLAVPRKFKKGETDFLNMVAFGKTAENINTYFKKGNLILVETHVQTGSYDDKNGIKRYTQDYIIDNFDFVNNNNNNDNKESGPSKEELGFEEVMPGEDGDMPF